jgi:hypothetical protein
VPAPSRRFTPSRALVHRGLAGTENTFTSTPAAASAARSGSARATVFPVTSSTRRARGRHGGRRLAHGARPENDTRGRGELEGVQPATPLQERAAYFRLVRGSAIIGPPCRRQRW